MAYGHCFMLQCSSMPLITCTTSALPKVQASYTSLLSAIDSQMAAFWVCLGHQHLHVCHRLLPQLIQHGSQQPALANLVIAELPAANQCTLQLLLETFHRLSGNAAVNEMDAHTVATVMTPCVAWNPPPKPKVKLGSWHPYSCYFRCTCDFLLWKLTDIRNGLLSLLQTLTSCRCTT